MNEAEIKEMKAIFSEYLEKTQGYETQIQETYAHVEQWVKDPHMQISTLNIATHSLSCSRFYASKAVDLLRALSDRISERRKEARNVA